MDQQQRQQALQLLRQAAAALEPSSSATPAAHTTATPAAHTTATPTAHSSVTSSLGLGRQVRNIFAPYSRSNARRTQRSFWTHRFCVLGRRTDATAPTREEKDRLYKANLGEKKVTFEKNDDAVYFRKHLEDQFPKLRDIGGFELLRTQATSRTDLDMVLMPSGGYNSNFLANCSNLGQAVCYVRPIQTDLSLVEPEIFDGEGVQEKCLKCQEMIPLRMLRMHAEICGSEEKSGDDIPPPPTRRRSNQAPVCQYACASPVHQTDQADIMNMENTSEVPCPICGKKFQSECQLEVHASTCGETTENRSLTTVLEEKLMRMKEKDEYMHLQVVRRIFSRTALEQLKMADEEDWHKLVKVTFIGEEGVDAGGLTREFFTLIFDNFQVFDNNGTFYIDSQFLQDRRYQLVGKLAAVAIVHGHPGPSALRPMLAKYILTGSEPNVEDIDDKDLGADILNVIEEIKGCSENIAEIFNLHAGLLHEAGFRRMLTLENKSAAVNALKIHNGLYKYMAPMMQFMEGLKLHGVLSLLQEKVDEGMTILSMGKFTPADKVMDLFTPTFSKKQEEKEVEELVIYNWNMFLKNVERGNISTHWLALGEDITERDVTLNMGHVLQALVGCPRLPTNMTKGAGIIEFDHIQSSRLSTANTCVPSLRFSSTELLQDYTELEKHILHIITETDGFGIV